MRAKILMRLARKVSVVILALAVASIIFFGLVYVSVWLDSNASDDLLHKAKGVSIAFCLAGMAYIVGAWLTEQYEESAEEVEQEQRYQDGKMALSDSSNNKNGLSNKLRKRGRRYVSDTSTPQNKSRPLSGASFTSVAWCILTLYIPLLEMRKHSAIGRASWKSCKSSEIKVIAADPHPGAWDAQRLETQTLKVVGGETIFSAEPEVVNMDWGDTRIQTRWRWKPITVLGDELQKGLDE